MSRKVSLISRLVSLFILLFIFSMMIPYITNVLSSSFQYNISNEIRDFAGIRVVQLFLDGINPYTIESNELMQVPSAYIYNAPNCILAALLCKLFGIGIIESLYFVNFILLFLSATFLFLGIRRFLVLPSILDNFIVLSAIVVLVSTSFTLFGTLLFNLRVDTFGIFILSTLLFCMSFHNVPVILLSSQIMLLFLTKFYLVIFVLPVFIFYFMTNRKKSYFFLFACLVEGTILLFILNTLAPLYLTDTIYVQYISGSNKLNLFSVIKNAGKFFVRYIGFILTAIIGFFFLFWFNIKKERITFIQLLKSNSVYPYLGFLFLNILFASLILLFIGQNGDDGYKYFQSMLFPPLIIFSILIFERALQYISHNHQFISKSFLPVVCLFTLYSFAQFSRPLYTTSDLNNWEKLYSYLSKYNYQEMYLSQIATNYLIRDINEGFYTAYYDDGHLEYFKNWKSSPMSALFVDEDKIETMVNNYWNLVNSKIAAGEFEIVVDNGIYNNLLPEHYTQIDTINLKNDIHVWTVNIWIKK